jgi:hypothetical protein
MNEATSTRRGDTGKRAIRWSTAGAVICVAAVAAVVSYEHAYAVVRAHGEDGVTARLVPLTVDGLIYASSMVMLHSARRQVPVPRLARWLLGLGIVATLAANAAHGLGSGPVGAIVAAWPAVALVGSYELLMLIIRSTESESTEIPAESPVPDNARVPDPLEARAGRGVLGRDSRRAHTVRPSDPLTSASRAAPCTADTRVSHRTPRRTHTYPDRSRECLTLGSTTWW